MVYVRNFGRPDLFIIMTCNSQWSKIKSFLFLNQHDIELSRVESLHFMDKHYIETYYYEAVNNRKNSSVHYGVQHKIKETRDNIIRQFSNDCGDGS